MKHLDSVLKGDSNPLRAVLFYEQKFIAKWVLHLQEVLFRQLSLHKCNMLSEMNYQPLA